MKKTATIVILLVLAALIFSTPVSAFDIRTMPDAQDLTELKSKLSKNGYGAYDRPLSGEKRLWQDLDTEKYTIVDKVMIGAPTPGAEPTEIERWSLAYPTGGIETRVPEKEYTSFQILMPHAKDEDDFIEQAAWIKAEFGKKSTLRNYADKPTDWEAQRDWFLENGYSWQSFHGYQALVKEDYHPDDADPDKENAYSDRGYSAWYYVVVLVPEGQADYVAYVTITVKTFVGAPVGVTYNYDGSVDHYGVVDAEWIAASKSLWDTQTLPAIEGAIDGVFALDFRFARQRVYTGELVFGGEAPKKDVKTDGGVTQHAQQDTGEDGGVSVPAAIVIGVISGGAAIISAAGADVDDKKKSYKMYIQKDFGDAIRRGAAPVKIRARMVEADAHGNERDRNDLTAKIGVFGDGMTVHAAALVGRYCEATVSVPAETEADAAKIAFVFEGEGGSFTNTVIFRLIDGASLAFVEETETPGAYTLYTGVCGIDAIPGDGFTYTEQFMVVDATVPPSLSDITAVDTGSFAVTFEMTERQYVYRMRVKNNTPPDPDHGVFAKPREERFEFKVKVAGEREPLTGYAVVTLYPEGITVDSDFKGEKKDVEYIRVQAYEKENVGDFDTKWQSSQMTFTFAIKGKDRVFINPHDAEIKFENIIGGGGLGTRAEAETAVAEKYTYKGAYVWNRDKCIYQFEPQDELWEPAEEGKFYIVKLPVKCRYNGLSYTGEVPLRLRGRDPDPLEEWNREYAKTVERFEKFSTPGKASYNLEMLEKVANGEHRISVEELRLMNKSLLREYIRYWESRGATMNQIADVLDWTVWGLEWVKWIGDCAFSYVASAYAGPMEALITPAKDVLVSALAEVGVNILWGTKFDVEHLEICEQLKNAGDNFVSGWAADGASDLVTKNPANIKYAVAIMGAYFGYACLNNYLKIMADTGESDFYGAITGALQDLTVTATKAAAGMLFKKWLNSANFKEKVGPKFKEYFVRMFGDEKRLNDFFGRNFGDQTLSGGFEKQLGKKSYWMKYTANISKAEIVEKYITELCGAGAAWVYENPEKAEICHFIVNPAGHTVFRFTIALLADDTKMENAAAQTTASRSFGIDVDIWKVLENAGGDFFNFLYEMFFGGVPTAKNKMPAPKDPPLPPTKK